MYDDGGGCSGKDADVSKKIQRQAWGALDLTVRWTDQLLLYSTLCFLLGTYCTIKLLFYYWHQTAAIIDNRYSKG